MGIVIDTGSAFTKATADTGTPVSFPTVVGRPTQTLPGGQDVYVGDAAWARRSFLKINHPVHGGFVQSPDDAVRIWQHAVKDRLGRQPADHPLLLVEPVLHSSASRESITKLMFDAVGVKAFSMLDSVAAALASTGRSTGLIVDIGADQVQVVAVHNGQTLPRTLRRSEIAGTALTQHLRRLLTDTGHPFTTSAELDVVRDIKETVCYVAASPDAPASEKKYTLPDGVEIFLLEAAWRCPEAMFQPLYLGVESPGLPDMIDQTLTAASTTLTAQLLANIVLVGGSSQFPGLATRLTSELKKLRQNATITITVAPDPRHAAIRGGLTRLKDPTTGWITTADYDKHGPALIHNVCPTPTT